MPKRSYTKEMLSEAVIKSTSIYDVLRHLGLKLAGGSHANIAKRIRHFGIDTSHFHGRGSNRGESHKGGPKRKGWQEVLVIRPQGTREEAFRLRRALIESGVDYRCVECGIGPEWNGKELRLEVEHLNRDIADCRRENLRFMCPNCHSQAPSNGMPLTGVSSKSEWFRARRRKNALVVELVDTQA